MTVAPVDITVALDRFATLLACTGEAGLTDALALLVDGLGLRSAALRTSPGSGIGELIAVAGEVVYAVAVPTGGSGPRPVVELPVQGLAGRPLATLTVVDARPGLLPALRVAAAVLGVALSAEPPGAVADALLAGTEQEREELADTLHDGPVQDLVVARYAAESALRGGEAAAVTEAVQLALVGLRRALWHLRPRGHDGLAAALGDLSSRLVESGRRPLLVQVLAGGDELRGTRAVEAYRLVQSVVLPGPLADAISVTLRGERDRVMVQVDGAPALREPTRWQRRASALGGELTYGPGRLQLALPAGTNPTSHSRPLLTPKAAL